MNEFDSSSFPSSLHYINNNEVQGIFLQSYCNTPLATSLTSYVYFFQALLQICAPAIVTEMNNLQTENIKILLHNQVVLEKDVDVRQQKINMLRYMKAHRLHKEVWNIIPLDLRLPVSVFSFCATYLIIIIQFTHLYD